MKGRGWRQKQDAFLSAFVATSTITHAAEMAQIRRGTHYEWMRDDPTYPERFENAKQKAIDKLEREAVRRAVEGVEEPTGWYQGEPGGYVRKYSDTLLIFLLKGARPEKYRERFDFSGKIQHEVRGVILAPATLPADEWAELPAPEPPKQLPESKPS